jgi:hypothetical protein
MEKMLSMNLGITLIFLTVAGFLTDTKHLMKLMNIDTSHSILRIPLILALLYGGSKADLDMTRLILLGVGGFYLAMGTAGLVDKKVGGTLPSGLTKFDIFYHFVVGAEAVWLGARPGRMTKSS